MNEWKITVIQVGSIECSEIDLPVENVAQKPTAIPILVAALTDGEHKVLVDTGIGDDIDAIIRCAEPFCRQTKEQETLTALKRAVGWNAEDVDLIINTHLHYDHCGCNGLFPAAKCCLQKKEWEVANEPSGQWTHLYYTDYFCKKKVPYFKWWLLDGEKEIWPGLIVFPTPGHTPGHQSVLIHTAQGTVCYAGDAVTMIENLQDNIPTSIVANVDDCLKSYKRIRQMADYVIPGHDYRIVDCMTKDFLAAE